MTTSKSEATLPDDLSAGSSSSDHPSTGKKTDASSVLPTTLHRQASHHISVLSASRRPRAIVLLFGWMGAESTDLAAYAKLYHDRACSTISATAPTFSVVTSDRTALSELAITACREAARLIRMGEISAMGYGQIPVILHAFGNGGAFVVEELERRIGEVVGDDGDSDIAAVLPVQTEKESNGGGGRHSQDTDWRQMASFRQSTRTLYAGTEAESDEDEDQGKRDGSRNKTNLTAPNKSPSNPSSLSPREKSTPEGCRGKCPKSPTSCINEKNKSDSKKNRRKKKKKKKKHIPKVHRIDLERTAFNSPDVKRPTYNSEERAYNRDLSLVASRLRSGYVLFDSGPCYITFHSGLIATEKAVTNPICKAFTQGVWCISYCLGSTWEACCCDCSTIRCSSILAPPGLARPMQFWDHMENSTLSPRHGYVYSTSDPVCDHKKLEGLIQAVEGKNEKQVDIWKFDNTDHVQHIGKRREEYEEMIDDILDEVALTFNEDDENDDWWSSSDDADER